MSSPEVPTTTFADGSTIPLIGFGTGGAQGPQLLDSLDLGEEAAWDSREKEEW